MKNDVASSFTIPYADLERFIAESWTYRQLDIPRVFLTFEEDASKQSSLPILERPTRILENGRSDVEGIVASNNVVAAEGAIPSGRCPRSTKRSAFRSTSISFLHTKN